MRIGELSKKSGCSIVTIRYYEREGLLLPPERTHGNYRVYDTSALERLTFIMHCRHHGMKLGDIRALLAYRDRPLGGCGWIHTMLDKHLEELDGQIEALQKLRADLKRLRERGAHCPGHESGDDEKGRCDLLRYLDDTEICGCCDKSPHL
jgi:DNA-binding transcriptional MerR regulator